MMKGSTAAMFALTAALAAAAWGETSVKLEEKAALKLGEGGRASAVKAYRAAAAQRVAEAAKLFAKAGGDELDIDLDAPADDEVLMPGESSTAERLKADTEALHYLKTAEDFNYGARPFQYDRWMAKAKGVKGVSKRVAGEIAKLERFVAADRDPTEKDPPPPKPAAAKPVPLRAEREALDAAIAAKRPPSALRDLWSKLAYQAFLHFRPDVLTEARDEIAKLKKHPGCYPGRWLPAIRAYENLKTFPKAESETAAPKTLKDMGVAERHTVVVGELDWDAENATECVEAAIASGATTLIFEDRGSPWYVRTIVPRSNQRLVFKKGVKVLMDKVSRQLKDRSPMIALRDVRNVIIEGEGGPGDVYIGKYSSMEERCRLSNDYGGDGLLLSGARNCVVRNLTFGANSDDGVCVGGGNAPSQDVWLENLVLRDNYRQAMSVCDAVGLYCRNVSFLNTIGGDPMCGIDFEPTYETEGNADCYFYDCTFGGNAGSAVNWSSSSFYPVTCHMKRCHFEKARNCGQITVFARCGIYLGNDVKAPSKLVFEDCDMNVNTDSFPLKIDNASFFDIEVKNFKVKDIGPHNPNAKSWGNSPVTFNLTRNYGKGINDYQRRCGGKVHIEGLEVTGWETHPIVDFRDRVGTYSVGGLTGSGTMNGKTYDLSQFRHDAPETGFSEVAKFDPGDYLPPAKASAANPPELPANFGLVWSHAWFEAEPVYRALYFEGGAWKMMRIQQCVTELGLRTQPVAYYCRGNDSVFKVNGLKGATPYTLYFEVPPGGKACPFKLISGAAALKNAKGEVVKEFGWSGSVQYAMCAPASSEGEIWSLTVTSGAATFRFFAPFAGIVAESPDALPRRRPR